ncbi:tryptophan 7-halogenase [Sphingomonas sp. BGYR3]|uniref:tryptophan halogenase family protein n=1 Tax=Sphingomonas sp. BGYR3 TaxID=2975483 RepID=UPI0021A57C1A|nr:tryptophan 7-halogenase [Sphingomonas sp. BGYR3]
MSGTAHHIVILGGGTAGWMAACLIAHHGRGRGVAVTVVESPDIGIIGVGEGSTPHLKHFFDTLGIAEREWMPACDATYKTGIRFSGWGGNDGPASYFHPFPTEIDRHSEPDFLTACAARRRGEDVPAHPDDWYLTAWLAEHGRAPIAPDHFPFRIGYGYHFDAHKVGAFLRGRATAMGAAHLSRTVDRVEVTGEGTVAALILDGGERLAGDFFIDCSGFRSLIHQQALGVPFLPFADNLFNDRAVVAPTPLPDGEIAPQTGATALSAGWVWRIPLTSRVGNGYVHSSRYIDKDAAEAEFRRHIDLPDDQPVRFLDMKVGRVADSWVSNSLAVGLSQGFLEPLEATALHIVQATLEAFIQTYWDGGFTPRHRDTFNRTINARYEGIRDYIVAHYRMNRRQASDYWTDAAGIEALSDPLKQVMTAWFTRGDVAATIEGLGIARYYTPMSWHALMAGYGTFPARLRPAETRVRDVADVRRFIAACGSNFPAHRAALAEA